jgi:hypothetical protein
MIAEFSLINSYFIVCLDISPEVGNMQAQAQNLPFSPEPFDEKLQGLA